MVRVIGTLFKSTLAFLAVAKAAAFVGWIIWDPVWKKALLPTRQSSVSLNFMLLWVTNGHEWLHKYVTFLGSLVFLPFPLIFCVPFSFQLPGRTDNEIKNFWNTRLKKLQRLGLPIYPDEVREQAMNAAAQNGQNSDHSQESLEPDCLEIPEFDFKYLQLNNYQSVLLRNVPMGNMMKHCSFQPNMYNLIGSPYMSPNRKQIFLTRVIMLPTSKVLSSGTRNSSMLYQKVICLAMLLRILLLLLSPRPRSWSSLHSNVLTLLAIGKRNTLTQCRQLSQTEL